MLKFKVVKANGWNRYKVQKRFLFFFWRDVNRATFTSYEAAALAAIRMNGNQNGRSTK